MWNKWATEPRTWQSWELVNALPELPEGFYPILRGKVIAELRRRKLL